MFNILSLLFFSPNLCYRILKLKTQIVNQIKDLDIKSNITRVGNIPRHHSSNNLSFEKHDNYIQGLENGAALFNTILKTQDIVHRHNPKYGFGECNTRKITREKIETAL
ncbi:hypothetical protein BpHYR1_046662 [Brachionus plicatilis]|uniref:Uncharacterized protein n=1 Tax=Brachionus plicatilis TaxID=10195 RepID=A0A3M7RVQ0_BRAPC|nr:hypothetical protein BpHYR1_046662 [Brachionus plicatilis]